MTSHLERGTKMKDINIQIAGTEYVVSGMTFEIYTQGCSVECPGCQNPETWDWNAGTKFPAEDLKEKFTRFDRMIKKIWILGGEPLQQDLLEVIKMLKFLKQFDKEVWLFTSKDMYQIYPEIRNLCDYIKTGFYNTSAGPGTEQYGVKLATANQKIWKKGVDYEES